MTPKERASDINEKLQAAHAAVGESAELDALHQSLADGLSEHSELLGLDEQDLADIEGVGTAARGGQPKHA